MNFPKSIHDFARFRRSNWNYLKIRRKFLFHANLQIINNRSKVEANGLFALKICDVSDSIEIWNIIINLSCRMNLNVICILNAQIESFRIANARVAIDSRVDPFISSFRSMGWFSSVFSWLISFWRFSANSLEILWEINWFECAPNVHRIQHVHTFRGTHTHTHADSPLDGGFVNAN